MRVRWKAVGSSQSSQSLGVTGGSEPEERKRQETVYGMFKRLQQLIGQLKLTRGSRRASIGLTLTGFMGALVSVESILHSRM